MDKLKELTEEYNHWAYLKECYKDRVKGCDKRMDKLKKEISELSKE